MIGDQRSLRSATTAIVVAVLLCAVQGCGKDSTESATAATDPPAAFEAPFVGRIDGSDAFVAIAVEDDKVWAYACDGQGNGLDGETASYFTGSANGTRLSATDEVDGATLSATLSGGSISGEVALPNGTSGTFVAVKASGAAGWFSAQVGDDQHSEVGSWIRLADGQVRGKVLSLDSVPDASGAPVPASSTLLGGDDVPPAAVPTGGLACYRATKKYYQVLNDPNSTTSQINGANNVRRDKCGIFDQAV